MALHGASIAVSADIDTIWEQLRDVSGPYAMEAYQFVQDGLRVTAERMYGELDPMVPTKGRHLTGQQLCIGLRDYAIDQFGLLARTVLHAWGIRRTDDFGRIVFTLVELRLLSKTEEDSLEDFANVFDFDEVFGQQLSGCLTPDVER